MKFIIALTLAFAAFGCGVSTSAGSACQTNGECQLGQTCNNGYPSGFCAKGCLQEGSTDECPAGTICSQIGTNQRYCAVICTDQAQCREFYNCNGVTASNVKACQP
jgi:hypothetical protein